MKLLIAVLPTILLATYSQLVIRWRVATLAATAAQSMSISERILTYLVDPFIISAYLSVPAPSWMYLSCRKK